MPEPAKFDGAAGQLANWAAKTHAPEVIEQGGDRYEPTTPRGELFKQANSLPIHLSVLDESGGHMGRDDADAPV